MKCFSATFELTLDISCPDHMDSEWVAKEIALRSKRFSVYAAEGDPDCVTIDAASSCLTTVRTYPTAASEHLGRLEPAPEQQSPPVSVSPSRFSNIRKFIGLN